MVLMGFRQRGDCGKDKEDTDMRKGIVVVKNYPVTQYVYISSHGCCQIALEQHIEPQSIKIFQDDHDS